MDEWMNVKTFLDALADDSPAPGGGSAAAVSGAMSAALIAMVCRLTIGKKKFPEVETECKAALIKAEALRSKLTRLIQEDTNAFNQVMAAYRLPKETEVEKSTRQDAIETALKEATRVPLETARACAHLISLGETMARIGNPNAASDAGVAVLCAAAGLRGAALNVRINLSSLKDAAFIEHARQELASIQAVLPQVDAVYRGLEEVL